MKVEIPEHTKSEATAWANRIIKEISGRSEPRTSLKLIINSDDEVVMQVHAHQLTLSNDEFFGIDGMTWVAIDNGGVTISGFVNKRTRINDIDVVLVWILYTRIEPDDLKFLIDGGFVNEEHVSTYTCSV